MMELSLQELEAAINYWRAQRPASGGELVLSSEVNILANLYALMIFHGARSIPFEQVDSSARQLLERWRAASAPPPQSTE